MLGTRPASLPRSLPGAGCAKSHSPLAGEADGPLISAGNRGRGEEDAVTTILF